MHSYLSTVTKAKIMINDSKDIKHKSLRAFYDSNGANTKGLQSNHVKNLRAILVHLSTATSLSDIEGGLGISKRHHKLSGYPNRYAMSVSGNYRVTYDCEDDDSGVVTVIDYEDYH